jgi:hypothetical protein
VSRSLVLGGLAASLLATVVASAALSARATPADACAPPFDLAALPAHDRSLTARRVLACEDLAHGRIDEAAYQAQTAAIDRAWSQPSRDATQIQWAANVRAFSTQYTAASWAAGRALGPPDVFPGSGDNANAWASLGADDRDESLEVGYAEPTRISAVDVFETYNPGAVSSIEAITASGKRLVIYQAAPGATGAASNRLHAPVECTAEPVVAVSVHVSSTAVPGWNEIDAIGVEPCQ